MKNQTMKNWKPHYIIRVGYAFPTSNTAKQCAHEKTGCFFVHVQSTGGEESYTARETFADAMKFAADYMKWKHEEEHKTCAIVNY